MAAIAASSGGSGGRAGVKACFRMASQASSSSAPDEAGPSSAALTVKPAFPEHLSALGSPKSRKQKQEVSAGLAAKERRKAMVYEVQEPRSSMPFLEQVWMTFEVTSFSPLAFWYAQFQLLVILFSTLSFTLETEINCKDFSLAEHGFLSSNNCKVWESIWQWSEYVAVAVFTFELICRFASCPSKWRFVQGVMNWVDLIAILPFYIELGVAAALGGDDSVLSAFSVFRVVRLVRVFRVFKMGKSSSGMKMMAATMAESLKVLTVLIFMVLIAVIVFSSAVFSFEQVCTHEGPPPPLAPESAAAPKPHPGRAHNFLRATRHGACASALPSLCVSCRPLPSPCWWSERAPPSSPPSPCGRASPLPRSRGQQRTTSSRYRGPSGGRW